MCPDFENDYGVTSYISFLDSLIDEAKDVIDLRKAGILRNLLGSDEEVALVFNEIGTNLVPNPEIYRDVRSKIQKYHEKKRMTYINEVIHNHFSSPWTVEAFTAALFALILSIAQTVYSYLGILSMTPRGIKNLFALFPFQLHLNTLIISIFRLLFK